MPIDHEKEARKVIVETQKNRYVRGPLSHLNYRAWKAFYPVYSYEEACPLMLPWFKYHHGSDDISRFNRAYLKKERKVFWLFVIRLFLWPFLTLLRILRETRHNARVVSRVYKVSLIRQLIDQMKLLFFFNIGPMAYYGCGLYRYRSGYEQYCTRVKLFRLLDRIRPLEEREPVDDKLVFFRECQRRGLPTPRIFAAGYSGQWMPTFGPEKDSLPPIDIVLKPANLSQGYGFELWRFRADNRRWEREGEKLAQEQLLNRCQSKAMPYLIQERLFNHDIVEAISPCGLANARLVTYKRSNDDVALFHGFFRMSGANMDLSSISQGGMSSLIDLSAGTLLGARQWWKSIAEIESHPDTGAKIVGTKLPFWKEACQLVKDAHKNFELPFIGWDVVLTPNGPFLLEGNSGWANDERFPILRFFASAYLEVLERKSKREGLAYGREPSFST